jgi:hypothetical protein
MIPTADLNADTVRLPVVRPRPAGPGFDTVHGDTVEHAAYDAPRRSAPRLDAARLWTGGLATAAVTALVALVGVLVIQVLARVVPQVADTPIAHGSGTALLCTAAALAALAATGLAHLLVVSTPRPIAYLGWIVGLATAAATVLPFTSSLPLTAVTAGAVVNLVIGLAVGSLVTGATVAAIRSGDTA